MKILKRFIGLTLAVLMLSTLFVGQVFTAKALTPLPHLLQADEPWGSVLVGGATIARTGCGILSLSNSVGYLTGKRIDIVDCANWAYSVKGFNYYSNSLGTYRDTFYNKVEAKYGAEYGFTVDCGPNGSGYWLGATNTQLQNHLANGGVAIGHIPGHFIAIVDYNPETKMFHVLDSAPAAYRGTSSNRGDVWLSLTHLTTDTYEYKLDWFCLLTATGTPADEQDNEKEYLANAISAAQNKRYSDFGSAKLGEFRAAFNTAVDVYNNASSTSENYKVARTALESAMNYTNAISKGKSYTATASTRTDEWKDDGVRLTDGVKGSPETESKAYAGWQKKLEVVIDLGSAQSSNLYNLYLATNDDWGIKVPTESEFKLDVYASDSTNSGFSLVATTNELNGRASSGVWKLYRVNAVAANAVNARYIKFVITNNGTPGHIWIDEVEVASGEEYLDDMAYVTGVNQKIDSGMCSVFTPAFGAITAQNANIIYTSNIVVKWDSAAQAYVVTNVCYGTEALGESFTLGEGELLIAAHNHETGVATDAVVGSEENVKWFSQASVGDLVYLNGIDVANGKMSASPYIQVVHTAAEEPDNSGNENGNNNNNNENNNNNNGTIGGNAGDIKPNPDPNFKPDFDEEEEEFPSGDKVALGDVNASGDIDSMDYVLVKRAYFGTFELSESQLKSADVNASGDIDSMDYVLVKRAYFGTFSFN